MIDSTIKAVYPNSYIFISAEYPRFLKTTLRRKYPEILAEIILCGINLEEEWLCFGPVNFIPQNNSLQRHSRIFDDINKEFWREREERNKSE